MVSIVMQIAARLGGAPYQGSADRGSANNVKLLRRDFLAVAVSLLIVTGQAMAAQPSAASSSRIFGYTDDAGTTCLTNLAPAPSAHAQYQVLVEAESPNSVERRPVSIPAELREWVENAARREHVDSALIYAVMAVESGFNANAASAKGAVGLMQLMPSTAALYGVNDRFDGQSSISGGARYLHDLMNSFGNDLTLTVAAYNSGANAVHQYHDRIPPFAETQSYVPRVLALYRKLHETGASQ